MSFDEWKAAYRPRNAKLLPTSGPEFEWVLIYDFVYIWTLIETAAGLELFPGANFTSPLGYLVTEEPWDGGRIPANVPFTD
jgi:hypothetical protein